ncbi:hypothetical protein [Costertonia aggregata]|uniref:Lipocalin family protein n=1 Tax=Costertonia aggregata TaxID=343403 RepID=A0A7H9API5_9FLAO|nr:hypothetical protein [Costertonia aggregata]QLG45324.1 hypothetical protein HYG79_08170 [Costertonia aggregata]
MKTVTFILAIVTLFMSCSKIEVNNDPIIGIWHNQVINETNKNNLAVDKEEWIFNDVYLGRFHGITDNKVTFSTDFKWTVKNGVYTISYPGTDLPEEQVTLETAQKETFLHDINGEKRAIRIE